MTADQIIKALDLQPLPAEGGFYKVTHTSDEVLDPGALPDRYQEPRNLSGAIYYLVTKEQFSSLHKLPTDELYFFHYGDPLEILFLHPDGSGEVNILGFDLTPGYYPQLLAPRHSWQGSRPLPGGKFGFSLVSTSMAPGYHESDPEFGSRETLIAEYPQFAKLITGLTRLAPLN